MKLHICSYLLCDLVANYDVTKSSNPTRLAIVELNCLVQKQKNMIESFYNEISKYSQ